MPISNEKIRERIIEILEIYLKDTASAKILRSNGAYSTLPIPEKDRNVTAQTLFTEEANEKRKQFEASELMKLG